MWTCVDPFHHELALVGLKFIQRSLDRHVLICNSPDDRVLADVCAIGREETKSPSSRSVVGQFFLSPPSSSSDPSAV